MTVETLNILGDRYSLGKCLHRDRLTEVRQADSSDSTRKVAIKIPTDALTEHEMARLRQQFEQEVQTVQYLTAQSTPNLLSVNAATSPPDGKPLLVTPYMATGSLAELLAEYPLGISIVRTLEIWTPLLETLAHVHTLPSPTIHANLRPTKVLLRFADVKLSGWGSDQLGRTVRSGEAAAPLTDYHAPEQVLVGALSPATDVYLAGMLLYAMMTGKLYRPGVAMQAVERRALPEHSWLVDVLSRSLQPDPAHRYANAAEVLEDVRRHRTADASGTQPLIGHAIEKAVRTSPSDPPQQPPATPRRASSDPKPGRRMIGIVLALLLALAGGGLLLSIGTGDPSFSAPASPAAAEPPGAALTTVSTETIATSFATAVIVFAPLDPTNTPTPTPTNTPTPTPTNTPTPTPTNTPTPTAAPTDTPVPVPTNTTAPAQLPTVPTPTQPMTAQSQAPAMPENPPLPIDPRGDTGIGSPFDQVRFAWLGDPRPNQQVQILVERLENGQGVVGIVFPAPEQGFTTRETTIAMNRLPGTGTLQWRARWIVLSAQGISHGPWSGPLSFIVSSPQNLPPQPTDDDDVAPPTCDRPPCRP